MTYAACYRSLKASRIEIGEDVEIEIGLILFPPP